MTPRVVSHEFAVATWCYQNQDRLPGIPDHGVERAYSSPFGRVVEFRVMISQPRPGSDRQTGTEENRPTKTNNHISRPQPFVFFKKILELPRENATVEMLQLASMRPLLLVWWKCAHFGVRGCRNLHRRIIICQCMSLYLPTPCRCPAMESFPPPWTHRTLLSQRFPPLVLAALSGDNFLGAGT